MLLERRKRRSVQQQIELTRKRRRRRRRRWASAVEGLEALDAELPLAERALREGALRRLHKDYSKLGTQNTS
jgi:hypothetical protein